MFSLKFKGRLIILQIVSATVKVCLRTPTAQSHSYWCRLVCTTARQSTAKITELSQAETPNLT